MKNWEPLENWANSRKWWCLKNTKEETERKKLTKRHFTWNVIPLFITWSFQRVKSVTAWCDSSWPDIVWHAGHVSAYSDRRFGRGILGPMERPTPKWSIRGMFLHGLYIDVCSNMERWTSYWNASIMLQNITIQLLRQNQKKNCTSQESQLLETSGIKQLMLFQPTQRSHYLSLLPSQKYLTAKMCFYRKAEKPYGFNIHFKR